MKAAELESATMNDPEEPTSDTNETNTTNTTNTTNASVNETSSTNTDIQEQIKEALSNNNLTDMLSRINDHPEEIQSMVNDSMNTITPEMMSQARNLASGAQGNQIMREMQRRGMNPRAMKSQLADQQRAMRVSNKNASTQRAILITASRKLKPRDISLISIQSSVPHIINSSSGTAVEISCSRLALGPLSGKTIKAWYDSHRPGKNKRASKIVGFAISGELLIIMEEGDLTEADFLAAEKLLA